MEHTAAPLALIGFGFVLGMRHALEPDHLAAISTLVDGGRRKISVTAKLGALWGLGHTLAILWLGGALLLLRTELSQHSQAALELGVASMLAVLGARGLRRSYLLGRSAGRVHDHGEGIRHSHGSEGTHLHVGPFALGLRPVAIGLVHGLAGTGALTSLVMATLPTIGSAFLYLGSFGLGSLLGMASITFTAGLTLQKLRALSTRAVLNAVTGMASLSYGLYWGAQQLALLR